MSTRKKWRLQLIPLFIYEPAASQVAAYRKVDEIRALYAEGRGRTHHVNVQVNDGTGWRLYEKCIFPEREVRP